MAGGNGTLIVLAFLLVILAVAVLWRGKTGKRSKGPKIEEIRIRRKINPDSGLEVTLVESSSGWQLLDESDSSGNGVLTVYEGPAKPTKTMKCYSIVRRSASIYNRRTYELLKTECVKKFSVVKEDFSGLASEPLSASHLPRSGFEGIMDYLKQHQVIRP